MKQTLRSLILTVSTIVPMMFYNVMGNSGIITPTVKGRQGETSRAAQRIVERGITYSLDSYFLAPSRPTQIGVPVTGFSPAKYRTGGMCQYVRIGNLKLGSHGDALKCS